MIWEDEAQLALKNVPFFVRPLAKKKIEEAVAARGGDLVSLEDYREAEARFKAVCGGRGDGELQKMMPAANEPGVEMVIMESCRAELTGCPNHLQGMGPWRGALEAWLRESEASERIRRGVKDSQVLFHHKLKIALSSCPNGCARHQIADLAMVSTAEPEFDAETCTGCGLCSAACPDEALCPGPGIPERDAAKCQGCLACSQACPVGAVSLKSHGMRVLAGGKLGRHPHLAEEIARVHRPEEAVEVFSRRLEEYLAERMPGERFSAWWVRQKNE